MTDVAGELLERAWREAWEVPERLSIPDWADRNMLLTARTSSEPGDFRTDRFPFIRRILLDLSPDEPVQRVVWMAGRQVAKSTVGRVWTGYVIDQAPGPMLIAEPNISMMKKFSRLVLQPMLEEIPCLKARVRQPKSRDPGNTLLMKEFDDGVLMLANAGSSAAMRGSSARYFFGNEVNEYDENVDGAGDALSIAESCTSSFPNRKIYLNGNPGVRGQSRIEKEFLRGDQRRYFIPCPSCGHMDILTWEGRDWFGQKGGAHHRIRWDKTPEGKHLPLTAHMVCGRCEARVDEGEKTWMLERGEWRATAEGDGLTHSYQLSALYSPAGFKRWGEIAVEFLQKKDDAQLFRAWVNDNLGETWVEPGVRVDPGDLRARMERYEAEVPHGVGVLVAGVDTQDDRLVYVVLGFGAGEECWLIEWVEELGDPAKPGVWRKLDEQLLRRQFRHESGQKVRLERVAVDTGGHHTNQVYQYCAARTDRGVYAVKGGTERNKPLVGPPSVNNNYKTPLFILCTDTGKYQIAKRLAIAEPGPRFIHLHAMDDAGAEEFVSQLTAERAVYKNGVRVWEEVYARNHVFDCFVYAFAALDIMREPFKATLADRAAAWSKPVDPEAPRPSSPAADPAAARRQPWVNRWRT